MKKLFLQLRYGILMSKRTLIARFEANHDSFTEMERDVIGALFATRFDSDEQLEQMCTEVLG